MNDLSIITTTVAIMALAGTAYTMFSIGQVKKTALGVKKTALGLSQSFPTTQALEQLITQPKFLRMLVANDQTGEFTTILLIALVSCGTNTIPKSCRYVIETETDLTSVCCRTVEIITEKRIEIEEPERQEFIRRQEIAMLVSMVQKREQAFQKQIDSALRATTHWTLDLVAKGVA